MGYSKYFNERNGRSGALWQGKYRNISVTNDSHFNYIPYYIHLNPLDLTMPKWREGGIQNHQKAFTELEKYPWSSHRLFLDPAKIPNSIINGTFFEKEFEQQSKYLAEIKNIISKPILAQQSSVIEYK